MQNNYITVTQLTKYIKFKVDTDEHLSQVFLRGEISNFKAHTRGHYYFTIKDENTRINAVMFSSSVTKCKFIPQDGMKVLVTGKVSVYEATGGYQIYINTLTEDGIGNLYIAFEQLKEKLSKEGLFDPSKKKQIPKYPSTIGIITAPTGAAIRDILSTLKRRYPFAKTILFPSLVQGPSAAEDIVKQIELSSTFKLDVLILGRGGGSIEDMWCFNDENVARAIASCTVPTISAVGHEIDFTISDFVADLRAPTPTGAAEMAVPNYIDVINHIKQMNYRLNQTIVKQIKTEKDKLNSIMVSYILKNPMSMYLVKEQKLDLLLEHLETSWKHLIDQNKSRLSKSLSSYLLTHPEKLYLDKKQKFIHVYSLLKNQSNKLVIESQNKFQHTLGKLETLNPLLTMKRGYAIIKDDNKIISTVKNVIKDTILNIELQDGIITTKVEEINNAISNK